MRVPWRDRPWDQFVCNDPLGNSSCTLLANIGPKRDDEYEVAQAGVGIDVLEHDRLPCLSERATFMSPLGYTVVKTHPYAWNQALKGKIHPTKVHLPGYAFEAVPFRWLNRQSLNDEIGHDRVPRFNPEAEDHVDQALGYDGAAWVMDGDNQRAVLDAFFEPVEVGHSLVFVYLKHSPLQEQRTDRLLVGAARVTGVSMPPMWEESGNPPFSSSMWETVVEHSLRPDMSDGILLPYQQLIPLLDDGSDIDAALAWAPEGRTNEFSYVTEHLSDDAAIEALGALERAANGMRELGVDVPDDAFAWLTAQTERLWQLRGPVPGLPGVLAQIGVQHPYVAARSVVDASEDQHPWDLLDAGFADPNTLPESVRQHLAGVPVRVWNKAPQQMQAVLRLLSALDISREQVEMLATGETDLPMNAAELLDNPYNAATCTYGSPLHVPFTTVDRSLFPPGHVTWVPAIPDEVALEGYQDRRRVEALIADVLEQQAEQGDTVLPVGEVLEFANAMPLSQPPNVTGLILSGLDLDHDSLANSDADWSPLHAAELADGSHGYKLARLEETAHVIRTRIAEQEARPAHGAITNARQVLDEALDRNQLVNTSTEADALEERARTEKAAGLSALHDAPLSVLIGPAGTGKTTLLKALVDHPGVAAGGVLLLAPTGKARVQLETKVGFPAKTLASYLTPSKRYDGETGRYFVLDESAPRRSYSLVVIDEASMLTEEMLAATLDAFTGVDRLILVGDPRQLPPIGAGRPFVDLVNKLRPEVFSNWVRVAPGYVELQVPRRQLPDGAQGERLDLQLAAWFGDNTRGAADDSIWRLLDEAPDQPTIRYEPWGDRTPIQALTDTLQEVLGLTDGDEAVRRFAESYGAELNGQWINWEPGAGARAEEWQILSPTRSRAFGTVELNRHMKRKYRADDTAWAQKTTRKANLPGTIGPELIARGDKVMQTINRRLQAWPKEGALNYVANGEIGVAIGRPVPVAKARKNGLRLNVEFSSQPGFRYSYWPTDGDQNVMLELAWAVTVHKSQGSEFGITFLVLPARANVSRELMYTALTRQKDKVIVLHEGTLEELRDLAAPWRSETARRLTDLFVAPQPFAFEVRGKARRFDRKLLHVAANGTPMASKNEVIIAGLLDQLVPGRWQYEQPLVGSDGREVLPDFTIAAPDGRTVYWEHAGMLDLPDYARKWELKKSWYAENGILPADDGGGANGVLMWTDDLQGADAQAWLAHAAQVLGSSASSDGDPARATPVRRATKKTAKRTP